MNKSERKLKSIVASAADAAGVPYGRFRAAFGVDELFNTVLVDDDDPSLIAAKAMEHLCSDGDGVFNGNMVGLKAVLQFLGETAANSPQDLGDVKACQEDLRKRRFVREDLQAWLNQWYEF